MCVLVISFETCDTLVYIYIFKMFFSILCLGYLYPYYFCKLLGLFSCTCRLLWFVPMPCCIVLVVLSCITSSTFTLVPSRILFLDAYLLCALVECWTCK